MNRKQMWRSCLAVLLGGGLAMAQPPSDDRPGAPDDRPRRERDRPREVERRPGERPGEFDDRPPGEARRDDRRPMPRRGTGEPCGTSDPGPPCQAVPRRRAPKVLNDRPPGGHMHPTPRAA